ncbi:hypothetical protein L1049_028576 [Liquidambar formosana]|uniref:Uncharacterized protein n=1 Tax=Liquidambar formosana TaxID=63359 RepID=A0AAP0WTF3_LIQFO
MERYVPKPVAKELAQQGGIQQNMSPPIDQTASDETTGRAESGVQSAENTQPASLVIGKVGFSVESRNGDGKQNKQAKAHGSWRQRSSTESARVQDGSSFSSKTSKDEQSIEHSQPLKPDLHSVKGQPKPIDEWNPPDGWNASNNSDSAAPVTIPVVKDQAVTGRGKRHPYKGQKGMGNNNLDLDRKNGNIGDVDKVSAQSSAVEISEMDRPVASKENRVVGERSTSHWQPKSQAYLVHNQRGSRPSGGQNVNTEGRFAKKESAPQGGVHLPQKNKETSEGMIHSHSGSDKSIVGEVPNLGNQEAREKKVVSVKGRPHSLNQGSVSCVEPASPAGVDSRHEQQPLSSGVRKNGNQNSRFGRGHESRGDWSSAGQDSKQHNPPGNRERQRHNSHFEYQPVEPYNNNKSSNFEGPIDGSHNTSSKFRERGQSHSRRGGGNFYGRQSGTVRVDAGYD